MEHALELLLAEDQQVVQACLSDAPQIAFADGIGSWCMNGDFEHLNPTGGRHASKARPKRALVLTNQIRGCLPIWGRFSELLRHPGIGQGSCHADMDHPSRLQFDEEEGLRAARKNRSVIWRKSHAQICPV
jgi:hypothetical protein